MLRITVRAYSEVEKEQLQARLPTRYQQVESFAINFIFSVFLLLLPLLLTTKYFPVSTTAQAVYSTLAVLGSFGITCYIERAWSGSGRTQALHAIDTGQAEVLHVLTNRAIERADPEDFGTAFYLEIGANEDTRLLYLQGQYLDELEEEMFPTTEFKLIRRLDTREVIGFELLGQYFKPERLLPAFSMEQWRAGHTPTDGDILPGSLENLM